MRYLVTGGAGFIGSNFIRHLLKREPDAEITVLDKLTYAASGGSSLRDLPVGRVRLVMGDITQQPLVEDAGAGCDVIVHLAAETHVDNSIDGPEAFLRTNVEGTFRLLRYAQEQGLRFHHISTDEVYGDLPLQGGRFTEETPYTPSSPYSATKASSDHLVRAWVRTYGLLATISNCSNNYGPYQHVEKLIPRAITNLLEGARVKLYGTGENVRDWIHVQDHCEAVYRIIHEGRIGETYLVGSDSERDNRQVLETICALMDRDPAEWIESVPDRPGHDLRYAIDATKIRSELGWTPSFDFEDGLAQTIDWYEANQDWWTPQKEDTEARYTTRGR